MLNYLERPVLAVVRVSPIWATGMFFGIEEGPSSFSCLSHPTLVADLPDLSYMGREDVLYKLACLMK
jgi:hypothetical protein